MGAEVRSEKRKVRQVLGGLLARTEPPLLRIRDSPTFAFRYYRTDVSAPLGTSRRTDAAYRPSRHRYKNRGGRRHRQPYGNAEFDLR